MKKKKKNNTEIMKHQHKERDMFMQYPICAACVRNILNQTDMAAVSEQLAVAACFSLSFVMHMSHTSFVHILTKTYVTLTQLT